MGDDNSRDKKRFELVENEAGGYDLMPGTEPKEEIRSQVNEIILSLLENYQIELSHEKSGVTPIRVDEISSKLAILYERVRKIIDWKDDNALRRSAIERILKRILFPKLSGLVTTDINPSDLAETIATELIRGGHLPNDTIPRERAEKTAEGLEKYLYFFKETEKVGLDVKKRINLVTFIIEIAACEIEETLTRPIKEYGVIKAMTDLIDGRLKITPSNILNEGDRKKYIFIAVCKTLYDLDNNFIIYRLLKLKYPNFRQPDKEETALISDNLITDWKQITAEIEQPLTQKFISLAERLDTVFILIDDVLERIKTEGKQLKDIFEYKTKYLEYLSEAYDKRHKSLKNRLFRLGAFSTLSVFLSNWVTFYLFEVPLAKLFYEGFSLKAAIVDFTIPTLVMFFLVSIIRAPKASNKKKVLEASFGFVYPDEPSEAFRINIRDRSSVFGIVLGILYLASIVFVFWGVAKIFYIAKLPMTSVIFDTFTIALTVFAAHTIKNKSRELNVDDHMELWDFVLDAITLPIAKVGSIFAAKWKEYNVVAILFNFVVETPFAAILNFIQEWSEFLKERRGELH